MQEHPPQHTEHGGQSHLLRNIAIGGAVAGGAIILAPHILPAIGIGATDKAAESMWILHEAAGSGWASGINSLLKDIPLVGSKLAEGGLFNSAATALVGVGGVMLGKFIERREDNTAKIKWGKMIKYAALATSALIALPTVLTALGSGIIFLSSLIDAGFASSVVGTVDSTLGSIGASAKDFTGLSGIAATIPHFLTCGVSLLPAALAFMMDSEDENKKLHHAAADDYIMQLRTEKSGGIVTITHKDGTPLNEADLAVVHTRKLHLFVVDDSLNDYQHVHPTPTGNQGEFRFDFTPRTTNGYRAWAEFTPSQTMQMQRTAALMPYTGIRPTMPAKTHSAIVQADIAAHWTIDNALRKDESSTITINVTDKAGKPLQDMEPVMGAYAHLVGFSADRKEIIHCHPLGVEPKKDSDRGGPTMRFHITPTFDGPVQFFLQVKREGKEVFVPIAQRILPSAEMTSKLSETTANPAYFRI